MKIVLFGNEDFSMYHFRKGLIQQLVKNEFNVSVIVPPGEFINKLEELGVKCIPVAMERFNSPLHDLLLMLRLLKIFRTEKFDIIHNMTIKPNIYGTIAAALVGIRCRVCLVCGAGFMFMENVDWRTNLLQRPVLIMYRFALYLSHKVWFQNKEDLDRFVEKGIIPKEKGVVIRGSGVNIEEYSPANIDHAAVDVLRKEINLPNNVRCVLMVAARMVWSKGVKEFTEASKNLNKCYPDWHFIMICPWDKGTPDSVTEDYVKNIQHNQLTIIDSFRYDIKNFIAISDIVVLPSYYPEGVPRSLLEGLAMGKPLITTDHQGCRETVTHGENGYLISIKDSRELSEKLEILMQNKSMREKFGNFSRKKAETEFSESVVVQKVFHDLYGL